MNDTINTTNELTDKEKLVLETKIEVYSKIKEKIEDIENGDIQPDYYIIEIEREISRMKTKLNPPKPLILQKVTKKIEMIKPEHNPKDVVSYTLTDTPILFTVMEVNYEDKTYKLKTKNQIKPVVIVVGWDELDDI